MNFCFLCGSDLYIHARVLFQHVLSGPLPGRDVVYDPWAAVGHVVQGGVRVVEGWRAVLLLYVICQQVWQTGRGQMSQSECRNETHNPNRTQKALQSAVHGAAKGYKSRLMQKVCCSSPASTM